MKPNTFHTLLARPARLFLVAWTLVFAGGPLLAAGDAASRPLAGELFGQPVTQEEYDFAFKTLTIFAAGKEAENEEERRVETWKHLIFLKEAERRDVQLPPEELEAELRRLMAQKNVVYGSLAYLEFVERTFGESHEVFESRIRNLLRVKKLLDGILNPPPPAISDEECRQKYFNQYNSMATEFVRFPTLEEARAFRSTITPEKWDAEKKRRPEGKDKFCTPTGHISLEAVIDLWQVPTEDAYRVHSMKAGEISDPAPMVKGYGVFRMLEKKVADPAGYTDAKKEEYRKVLTQVYYYNKTQKVLRDIVETAQMVDYKRDKVVVFETNRGSFEVTLWPQAAPKACENFLRLADKGYYDGQVFHRVISGFMIQGGDPTGTGRGGESVWGGTFEDEVSKDVQFDRRGLLAMANRGPSTNGSQFFITLAPTPHLNMRHTIFGEVTKGYEVVHEIGQTDTDSNDRPVKDQKILKLRAKQWPAAKEQNA